MDEKYYMWRYDVNADQYNDLLANRLLYDNRI